MIASLTERDEQLDELQEDIKCQSEENEHLRATLASMSNDKDSSLQNISELKNEISNLQADLGKSKTALAEKDERIEQFLTVQERADKSISDLQNKVSVC
jgi:chromosome segregation ATPase